MRAIAQGLCCNVGRALAAFAPALIGAVADLRGLAAALVTTAAISLVGALLVRLLPETRGAELGTR